MKRGFFLLTALVASLPRPIDASCLPPPEARRPATDPVHCTDRCQVILTHALSPAETLPDVITLQALDRDEPEVAARARVLAGTVGEGRAVLLEALGTLTPGVRYAVWPLQRSFIARPAEAVPTPPPAPVLGRVNLIELGCNDTSDSFLFFSSSPARGPLGVFAEFAEIGRGQPEQPATVDLWIIDENAPLPSIPDDPFLPPDPPPLVEWVTGEDPNEQLVDGTFVTNVGVVEDPGIRDGMRVRVVVRRHDGPRAASELVVSDVIEAPGAPDQSGCTQATAAPGAVLVVLALRRRRTGTTG